ncbi:K-box region [Musa troglodytarum]|uniref:K-box region n=1 Tax=Musa troglodytarum TaxID=320322 RepID=A0A9E7JIL2_9LILI|nr:K-box region [Musa troglodytarum]
MHYYVKSASYCRSCHLLLPRKLHHMPTSTNTLR